MFESLRRRIARLERKRAAGDRDREDPGAAEALEFYRAAADNSPALVAIRARIKALGAEIRAKLHLPEDLDTGEALSAYRRACLESEDMTELHSRYLVLTYLGEDARIPAEWKDPETYRIGRPLDACV
jgi:hypothetical protein